MGPHRYRARGGGDPSFNLRLASSKVALDVIIESFPVGTGYGNFRLFGVYGAEFNNYINLDLITHYKTDMLLLNLVSELGVSAVGFIAMIYRAILTRNAIASLAALLAILFLFGTTIVPPLIVIVATAGLLSAPHRQRVSRRSVPHGLPEGARGR